MKHRKDLEISGMELLWIEFRVREHYFLCSACYRPPDTDHASLINFYDNFQLALDNIRLLLRKYNLVILGDLNSHYDNTNPHECTTAGLKFNSFLIGNNFTQLINEPNKNYQASSSNLDVLITNCPNVFNKTGTHSPPSMCDHFCSNVS